MNWRQKARLRQAEYRQHAKHYYKRYGRWDYKKANSPWHVMYSNPKKQRAVTKKRWEDLKNQTQRMRESGEHMVDSFRYAVAGFIGLRNAMARFAVAPNPVVLDKQAVMQSFRYQVESMLGRKISDAEYTRIKELTFAWRYGYPASRLDGMLGSLLGGVIQQEKTVDDITPRDILNYLSGGPNPAIPRHLQMVQPVPGSGIARLNELLKGIVPKPTTTTDELGVTTHHFDFGDLERRVVQRFTTPATPDIIHFDEAEFFGDVPPTPKALPPRRVNSDQEDDGA